MGMHANLKNALLTLGLASSLCWGQAQSTSQQSTSPSATPGNIRSSGAHASGHSAGTEHAGAGTEQMVGPADAKFMMEAAQAGLMEVQMAQLAQQNASSDEVKQYAKQLEQDHTKANSELKQIAQQKNITLPTDMGPKHQAMMEKMKAMKGEQFDKAYMKMMVKDHKHDVGQFRKQTDRGMDSHVKEFATKSLPVLEGHLQQAQQLNSGAGQTRSRTADKPAASTQQ